MEQGFYRRGFVRLEIPYVYKKDAEISESESGLGDIYFHGGFRIFEKKYFVHSAAFDVSFDTAKSNLGRGKTLIVPGWEASATIHWLEAIRVQ
jgi:hypothetical protein